MIARQLMMSTRFFRLKGSDMKIGFQTGTTGQFYCEGDAELGIHKTCYDFNRYKNGSLAVQDLINGNLIM